MAVAQAPATAPVPAAPAAPTAEPPASIEPAAAPSASELSSSVPSAPPAPAVQSEYFKVSSDAIADFDAGRFAEARSLFLRGHELWPSARTWRTLGMTAFELRLYPNAQAELQAALDDARRPLDAGQRAQVVTLLEQTRHLVGRYRLSVAPAEAELIVDGTPIVLNAERTLLLGVGQHELRVRASGYRELRQVLLVQGREDEQRTLTLEPEAVAAVALPAVQASPLAPVAIKEPDASDTRARTLRTYAWIAGGIGAAGLVTTAVFGGLSIGKKHGLDDHCAGDVCGRPYWDDLDRAKHFANAATAGLVIGLVGAATATTFWYLAKRSSDMAQPTEKPARLVVSPVGVSGSF